MKTIRAYISHSVCLLALAASAVLGSGCVREAAGGYDYERVPKGFGVCVEDGKDAVQTKSVLTAPDIETKITSVTVAAYDVTTGQMVGLPVYKTSNFDSITLELERESTIAVYAVANMGDMTSAFPSVYSESAFAGIVYQIPGYMTEGTGINTRGIPMSGSLIYTEGGGGDTVILLKRLMSKLSVHVRCDWPGKFNTVKIYNLNRSLRPFGVSAAASESDILGEQEVHVLSSDVKEGDFVFYIPENMQGTISGISSSSDKSRDNNAVTGKDLKSYMETVVSGMEDDATSGTMTYRSYLGNNATDNFDIERNSRYTWSVVYMFDHMKEDNWKHENELSWKEYTYELSAPKALYLGQESLSETRVNVYSNTYQNGALVSSHDSDNGAHSVFDFSVTPSDGSVIGNFYHWNNYRNYLSYTATGNGVATVSVKCTDPYNSEGVLLSKDVTVLGFNRELFLRTPLGDFYNGDTMEVPYGSNYNVQIGVKKTYPDHTEVICPVVLGSDGLTNAYIMFPGVGNYLTDISGHVTNLQHRATTYSGCNLVFNHTFDSFNNYQRFILYTNYSEGGLTTSLMPSINVTVVNSDVETISLSSNKTSAYMTDGGIEFTAQRVITHNLNPGPPVGITTDSGYSWTYENYDSGMNPQLVISGNKRVLTVSKAGSITVRITKNGNSSISATKTVTFNDRNEYRLNITPTSINCNANESFETGSRFTATQDVYVNGTYVRSEPFTETLYWSNKSGYSSYFNISNVSGSNYRITAKKAGTAYLRAYTYAPHISSSYNEKEITVNITNADVWTLEVSPSSASKDVNQTQTYTATVKRNGVAQSVSGSSIAWTMPEGTGTATLSASTGSSVTATAKTKGTVTIKARYTSGTIAAEGTATLTISDVVTYRYRVVTTVSPTSILVGGQATASAQRQKRTFVNGQATTGWVNDGDVTGSGFVNQSGGGHVTISGSTITGASAGSATIRSKYNTNIDEYVDASLSVAAPDSWTIEISPSSASKQVGQTQVFTATVKKNGVAQTVSGSTVSWDVPSGGSYASLSTASGLSTTATANAEGTATIRARYTSGNNSAEATATLSVSNVTTYQYRVVTTVSPTAIQVGGQATASAQRQKKTFVNGQATTDWVNDGDVTSSGFSAQSGGSYVTISGSTVTGAAAGTATIRSNYNTNVSSYQDATITVTNAPLTLSYPDGVPTYVAHRGLLKAGGVTGSGTTVSYSIKSGSDKVRLVANGNDTYVELLSSGSYTIKATASNGQTGEYSGSVTAPVLTPSTNSLNANPDGTVAKTGTFGLDGSTLSVSYKSTDGTVTFGMSGGAVVTGNYFQTSLYNELLTPQYSSSNSLITASADGIYANDVYTPTTNTLATVTVAPKVSSTGVSSKAVTVKGVNPFYYWIGGLSNIMNDLPDEEDFGLVNAFRQFHNHSYTSHTATFERIMATVTRCGIAVLRNGNALPEGALNSCFTSSLVSNSWKTTYTLSEAALSEHIGGEIALRGYVKNYYSNNYVYSDGGHSFRLYVNGAVGAKMEGAGTSVVRISTAWAGAEGSYAFGQMAGLGQAKFVTTDYTNGDPFYSSVLTGTTVQNVAPTGVPLGVVLYELHREGGALPAAQIKDAERPRFKFNSVSTLGVFIDDVELDAFYFLAPPGTPTFEDKSNGKTHGYYKLYLLENIDIRAKGGWVD